MLGNGASLSLRQEFLDVIEHKADNKDFFSWTENRNGLTMPSN